MAKGRGVDAAFTAVEERFSGPVEVLESNAGITHDGLLLRMSEDDFTDVLDANLTGGFRVAKRAVTSMMRQRYARIVFVSSVVSLVGQAGQANYAASKAGLIGMARSISRELSKAGVTANVVAPGLVDTDMGQRLAKAAMGAGDIHDLDKTMPFGHVCQPEEVAAVVRFLVSPANTYVTGEKINVLGGGR